MNWRVRFRSLVVAIDREYDRRIRAASLIKSYNITYDANEVADPHHAVEMSDPPSSTWAFQAEDRIAQAISNFRVMLGCLGVYAAVSVLTWLILLRQPGTASEKAFDIAFSVATGGDPFVFKADLVHSTGLWTWILLLHLTSWLLVPLLAAAAVDAVVRIVEQRRREAEVDINNQLEQFGLDSGFTPEQIAALQRAAKYRPNG